MGNWSRPVLVTMHSFNNSETLTMDACTKMWVSGAIAALDVGAPCAPWNVTP